VIEQAKGAIMTNRHCDADRAWAVLRHASQRSNVKLRVLAQTLVEQISRQPGDADHHPSADTAAHRAVAQIWDDSSNLTSPAGAEPS
jgi:hypothetical protein